MSITFFTPEDIAAELRVSKRFVQDLFREEKGVVRIGNIQRGRRARTLIRIPKDVKERVLDKFKVPGGGR